MSSSGTKLLHVQIFHLLIIVDVISCSSRPSWSIVHWTSSSLIVLMRIYAHRHWIIYNVNICLIVPSDLSHVYYCLLFSVWGVRRRAKVKLKNLHISSNNMLLNVIHYVRLLWVDCLVAHLHHSFVSLRSVGNRCWRLRTFSISLSIVPLTLLLSILVAIDIGCLFKLLLCLHPAVSIKLTGQLLSILGLWVGLSTAYSVCGGRISLEAWTCNWVAESWVITGHSVHFQVDVAVVEYGLRNLVLWITLLCACGRIRRGVDHERGWVHTLRSQGGLVPLSYLSLLILESQLLVKNLLEPSVVEVNLKVFWSYFWLKLKRSFILMITSNIRPMRWYLKSGW